MFKRNILISAQDAGGAVNIVPICEQLIKLNFNIKIIPSSFTINIFLKCRLNADIIKLSELNENAAEKFFVEFEPSAVLTGTSRYYSLDRIFLKLAKKYNKFSISVLDDWSNYKLRFLDNNNELILPCIICCMDDLAVNEAIYDGLPSQILVVTGSPYLSKLFDKRSTIVEQNLELLGIKENATKILFISETHAEDFGDDIGVGKMGDFLGYTEKSALNDIIEIISKLNIECNVIEKLHPSSKILETNFYTKEKINYLQIRDLDLHKLIYYSDLVIGMRSIALLESAIFGKLTVSYQPNLIPKYRPCTAERFAKVESLRSKIELETYLKKFFSSNEKNKSYFDDRPKFANENSINNIINLIIKNL